MNVPDDWHTHYRTCDLGHRYHKSEGGCGTCAAIFECRECRNETSQCHDGMPDLDQDHQCPKCRSSICQACGAKAMDPEAGECFECGALMSDHNKQTGSEP